MIAEDRRKFWLAFLLLLTMILSAALLSLAKTVPLHGPLTRNPLGQTSWNNAATTPPQECGTGGAPACPLRVNLAGRCGAIVLRAPRAVQVDICGSK